MISRKTVEGTAPHGALTNIRSVSNHPHQALGCLLQVMVGSRYTKEKRDRHNKEATSEYDIGRCKPVKRTPNKNECVNFGEKRRKRI